MAALEYLTQNSLTSHPFKNSYGLDEGTAAVDGWFYDILFVSYDDSIRRVYIQNIKKKEDGAIELAFGNVETLSRLQEGIVTINAEDVVDHYANKTKSFAGIAKEKFAVKIVLGPTLLTKSAFSEDYLPAVTELSDDATVLNTTRLDSITFEYYDGPELYTAKIYSSEETPLIAPRYNAAFSLTSLSAGNLSVAPNTGAGLYDNCPTPGSITDVYSLNEVAPNSTGSLFLTASTCHTLGMLTYNDEIIYGDRLDFYRTFTTPGNSGTFNAVTPWHTLMLENHCSPRCARESIKAVAYYINRTADGVEELGKIALKNEETRGIGTGEGSQFYVESNDFCAVAANIFLKGGAGTNCDIACTQGFQKSLHEGRTLQISQDGLTVTNHKIISVIDENTLRLDSALETEITKVPFRITDNGVVSNINCASGLYNAKKAKDLKPYFKVNYSTSEAFNADFEYVTYVAVTVALFNPGRQAVRVQVTFDPHGLKQVGSFKLRTSSSINISSESSVNLLCKEYAFVEAVYTIKCGEPANNFSLAVIDITNDDAPLNIGSYILPPLVGVSCPGDVAGGISTFKVLQEDTETFSQIIGVDPLVTAATIFGELPDWLSITFQPAQEGEETAKLLLTGTKKSSVLQNISYNLYVRYTGIAIPVVSQIIIHYGAPPIFLFPTAVYFPQQKPLVIDPLIEYTEDNPLIQVTVKNMDKPLGWSGSAFAYFGVSDEYPLPEGFNLDTTTGKITGRLLEGAPDEGYWEVELTATNPAALTTQKFYVGVSKRALPVTSFLQQLPTNIDNYTEYTPESPLCSFTATNDPILLYQNADKLPLGLSIDKVTGVIYGKLTELESGTKTVRIYARNFYGRAVSPLNVTITYTIYKTPTITTPTKLSRFNGEDGSSLESPLFTITATQALGGSDNFDLALTDTTRNHYTATNLPPGFSIDQYTGKVYGILDTSEGFSRSYAVRLIATNLVGSGYMQVYITFPNVKLPVITNLASGTIFQVSRNFEYLEGTNPLASVHAIYLNPTIVATGLPTGLTCLPSGEVVGTVDSSVAAGDYNVSFRAQNRYGVSTPAVTSVFRVKIELLSPAPNTIIEVNLNKPIVPIHVVVSSGVTTNTIVQNLPPGLVYTNNYISGSPTQTGKFKSYINVSAGLFGSVRAVVNIFVSIPTYKITGTVLNSDGSAAQNVFVSVTNVDTNATTTITTSSTGSYEATKLLPGNYNVAATKLKYETAPLVRNATIDESNITLEAFTITGPYRMVSGSVVVQDTYIPLADVAIMDEDRLVYSDENGRFFINLLQSSSITITADIESYVFKPKTISVAAGSIDVGGYVFTAIPAYNITGTILTKNTTLPTTIGVAIYNQETEEIYYDIATNGALSVQAVTGNYTITLNPTQSDYYNPTLQFSPSSLPVSVSDDSVGMFRRFTLFQGKLISGRVISPIYETELGLPIPVGDVAITAANIILNTSDLIWSELNPSNPPPIQIYLKTIQAVAASTENLNVTVNRFGFFSLRGQTVGELIIDGHTVAASNIILLKDQIYKELNGIYSVVTAGSTTEPFVLVRSSEANSSESLPIGTAIYITGGTLNNAKTFYLTTTVQATSISDIDGYFTLPNVFPDVYKLYAYKAGMGMLSIPTVDVTQQAATNFIIKPNTYSATGTIKYKQSAGSTVSLPLSDVRINLYRASDLFLLKKSEKSKADGSWIFRSIPDGSYVLKAELRGMTSTTAEYKLNVDDGDVNLIEFEVYISTNSLPSIPKVTNIQGGFRSLIITLEENTSDLGPEVRYYEYTLNSGETWTATQQLAYDKVIVSDVSAYTPVLFKLRAVSLFGNSEPTQELQGAAFDRPSPPEILQITHKNKELEIEYTAPISSGGLYIDNYAYSTDGGETFLDLSPASIESPITITKRSNNALPLVNGVTYPIIIRAMAGDVAGVDSAPVTATPMAPPSKPTLRTASGGTLGEIVLDFDPPEFTNGAAIINYAYSLNNAPFILIDTVQSPATITNTANGIDYSIRIAAVNSEGIGDSSNAITARAGTTPDAPSISKIIHSGGGRVKVYLELPPSDGYAAITGYVYYIDSPEGGSTDSTVPTELPPLDENLSTVIYNKRAGQGGDSGVRLEPNKTYDLSIAAVNQFGIGIASEKTEFFAITTVPKPLIINSYSVDYDRVTFNLSFEDNDTGGAGGFVTIAVEAKDADENQFVTTQTYYDIFNRTEYPITLTGLTPDVSYDIIITANNAAGMGA